MRTPSGRALPLLWALALVACDAPAPSTRRPEPAGARPAHPVAPRPPTRAPAAPSLGRIVSVEGTGASLGGQAVAAGSAFSLDEPLATGEATVTADLPNGARLVLFPGTVAARTDLGGDAVAIGVGQVQAILGAEGNSRRSPLRLATPAGELGSATSLEAVVSVSAGGRAAAVVLAGFGELSRGERSPEGRPLRLPVPAGRRMAFEATESEPLPGPLDAAGARRASTPSRRGASAPSALALVGPALETLEGLERRQQALDATLLHPAGPGRPAAGEDQRERVRIAQELTRARETLAALAHRLVAASLVDSEARQRLDADRRRLASASGQGAAVSQGSGVRD
ncbi:MAG: hypothetical protein U0230_07895 [Polyangiales bacterium]